MATVNKDFIVKNGIVVSGTTATVNGNQVLTEASSINALNDVTITSATTGQVLKYNGTVWVNDTDATGGGGGNSFTTISVAGQGDVVADSSSDTLTLVAGTNITITTNTASDSITITASGSGGGVTTGQAIIYAMVFG